jgi:hypothetical protein
MNKLQENLLKINELITEFKRAKIAESKEYHLINAPENNRYFLIRLLDNKIISDGYKDKIKSFCNLRNIDHNKILDIDLID